MGWSTWAFVSNSGFDRSFSPGIYCAGSTLSSRLYNAACLSSAESHVKAQNLRSKWTNQRARIEYLVIERIPHHLSKNISEVPFRLCNWPVSF